jgi:hypothetical protein
MSTYILLKRNVVGDCDDDLEQDNVERKDAQVRLQQERRALINCHNMRL